MIHTSEGNYSPFYIVMLHFSGRCKLVCMIEEQPMFFPYIYSLGTTINRSNPLQDCIDEQKRFVCEGQEQQLHHLHAFQDVDHVPERHTEQPVQPLVLERHQPGVCHLRQPASALLSGSERHRLHDASG